MNEGLEFKSPVLLYRITYTDTADFILLKNHSSTELSDSSLEWLSFDSGLSSCSSIFEISK